LKYRLMIARLEAGLDQQQLAEMMGVSRHVVSNAERGITTPRKVVLNAWALATGSPISWLETGAGDWVPPTPDDGAAKKARPQGLEPRTFCLGVKPHLRVVSDPTQQTNRSAA